MILDGNSEENSLTLHSNNFQVQILEELLLEKHHIDKIEVRIEDRKLKKKFSSFFKKKKYFILCEVEKSMLEIACGEDQLKQNL